MHPTSALYNPRTGASPRQIKAMDAFSERRSRLQAAAKAAVTAAPVDKTERTKAPVPLAPEPASPDSVEITACNGQTVTVSGEQIAEAWAMFERMGFDGLSPTVDRILREVCRYFSIAKNDLISARRTKNLVIPRQVAMYLAKTLTLKSLPEIGRRLGDRDHTTVLHAVRKMEHLVGRDEDLTNMVSEIRSRLLRKAANGVD